MSQSLIIYVTTVLIKIVPLTLFPSCLLLMEPLATSTVSLCVLNFCRLIGKPTDFFLLQEFSLRSTIRHYRRSAFSWKLKSKVRNLLAKAVALCINLKIDDASIASRLHTHPSHSQTSRLLTSSLSLGVSVPHGTQRMQGVQISQF